MAEYRAICDRCGESFHAEIEGYYYRKTQQYICPTCADKLLNVGGGRAYVVKVIADALLKLYFGVAVMLPTEGASADDVLAGAILGFAQIGWAVWAFVKALKAKRAAPNLAEMLYKVCLGMICISLITEAVDIVDGLLDIAIGLPLVVWGVLPYIRERKAEKLREDLVFAATEAEKKAAKTCPHCGATSRGNYCEYCGSAL